MPIVQRPIDQRSYTFPEGRAHARRTIKFNRAEEEYYDIQMGALALKIKDRASSNRNNQNAVTIIPHVGKFFSNDASFRGEAHKSSANTGVQNILNSLEGLSKPFKVAFPVQTGFGGHWQVLGLEIDDEKTKATLFDSSTLAASEEPAGLKEFLKAIGVNNFQFEYCKPYQQSGVINDDAGGVVTDPDYSTSDCGVYAIKTLNNIAEHGFENAKNPADSVAQEHKNGKKVTDLGAQFRAEQALDLAKHAKENPGVSQEELGSGIIEFQELVKNLAANDFYDEILSKFPEAQIDAEKKSEIVKRAIEKGLVGAFADESFNSLQDAVDFINSHEFSNAYLITYVDGGTPVSLGIEDEKFFFISAIVEDDDILKNLNDALGEESSFDIKKYEFFKVEEGDQSFLNVYAALNNFTWDLFAQSKSDAEISKTILEILGIEDSFQEENIFSPEVVKSVIKNSGKSAEELEMRMAIFAEIELAKPRSANTFSQNDEGFESGEDRNSESQDFEWDFRDFKIHDESQFNKQWNFYSEEALPRSWIVNLEAVPLTMVKPKNLNQDSKWSTREGRARANNFRTELRFGGVVADNGNEVSEQNCFAELFLRHVFQAAAEAEIENVSEVLKALSYAQRNGGMSNKYENGKYTKLGGGNQPKDEQGNVIEADKFKKWKKLSAKFQELNKECQIFTGREGENVAQVGLRFTFLPKDTEKILRDHFHDKTITKSLDIKHPGVVEGKSLSKHVLDSARAQAEKNNNKRFAANSRAR